MKKKAVLTLAELRLLVDSKVIFLLTACFLQRCVNVNNNCSVVNSSVGFCGKCYRNRLKFPATIVYSIEMDGI